MRKFFEQKAFLASTRLATLARSPLTWILLVVGVLHAVGIGWGLPASDGWDNDGVAPRDFLPGLAATLTPGKFYTYPPVHLAILSVLTAPITLVAVAKAPALTQDAVVHEILAVPYMTLMASVARLVALAMSLAIVVFLARIAEELRAGELAARRDAGGAWTDPRVARAGWCAAAVAGINASLAYYAHMSNLDVPYLFWAMWALLVFTRAVRQREPRLLRRALMLAVLAVGSKDQAYGIFLISLPLAFMIWIASDAWAKQHRGVVVREAAIAVALALALFAVVDGAVLNPTGFAARVRFLTGSASKDYAGYTADWAGRIGILVDAWRTFDVQYPRVFALAFVVGGVHVIVAAARAPASRRGAGLAIALLPLLALVSFTVTFNWSSGRSDPRFLLPQAMVLAVYGGRAVDLLVFAPRRSVRLVGQAVASIAFASGLFLCASVDANLIFDPRFAMEAWLAAHVKPGETIETYGLNVFMVRFPPGVRVVRVGPEPVDKRNPMPGIEEVQAPYEQAPERGARWIVVHGGWAWRFRLKPDDAREDGRRLPVAQLRSATDDAATQFFEKLIYSLDAFKIAFDARYDASVFPLVDVHGTTGRPVWVYERKPGR